MDLWDLARAANFTQKELESFKVRAAAAGISSGAFVGTGTGRPSVLGQPFPRDCLRSRPLRPSAVWDEAGLP